jgi:hypothetical protein
MTKKRFILIVSIALLGLVLASCAPSAVQTPAPAAPATETSVPLPPSEEPTSEPAAEPAAVNSGRISFDQLGISLEVPEELVVIKDPIVNLDDPSKLQSYLFYIQSYGPNGAPTENYFQMYGHLQYDLPPTTWDEYKNDVLNSDMYAYAQEINVNGLAGIDSQFTGERNRFVYHFLLDGRVLSIAVSDPTEENKALADQIINTLEYTPGSLTDASQVQLISEPNGYYQMYIPDGWEYTFNPPAGIRLSDLEASSPDAEIMIEDSDGPHSNIYYSSGVNLNIAVLEDDSALLEPNMAQVISRTPIMISGISGQDFIFTEPSTADGQIREVRYFNNGLSYLVRFSYALDADQEQIDWLIRNFQISQ